MPTPRNIFLVGPMGSGKSAVGSWLAGRLKWQFADSDRYIEEQTGVDIALIFEFEGEEGFRAREEKALEHLCEQRNIVLATGGGAVLRERNREALRAGGRVVYLKCGLDEQVRRTRDVRNRPLLASGPKRDILKDLMLQRGPLYLEVASHIVDTTGRRVRQVGQDILKLLKEN
ncbi:MAG: shikimate kinase [Gammaproteobacteria bacterium]|nr:shikimate kinase [Gammaproteobacteria bacterium]MYF57597.1 shikimate kinase [Gammaproteobacteria bacterium]MYH34953.1 shikimate kinase [Gammaproteobacteria bacterium]